MEETVIIAQLVRRDDPEAKPTTAYLAETPFPGDTVATADGRTVMVIRRVFLDLGPDYRQSSPVLSVRLEVRPT